MERANPDCRAEPLGLQQGEVEDDHENIVMSLRSRIA
jgi:hypothetical protein